MSKDPRNISIPALAFLILAVLPRPCASAVSPTFTPTPTPDCCLPSPATAWETPASTVVWGVVVDPDRSRIYTTDSTAGGGGGIYEYDYNGILQRTPVLGLDAPGPIARDPRPPHHIYVAEGVPGLIHQYDPANWTLVRTFQPGLGGLRGIHVDDSGNIYAATGNSVVVLGPTPTPVATLSGLSTATGLWREGDSLYVAETLNHRILRYRESGGVYGTPTPVATLGFPNEMWRDGAGRYYVTTGAGYQAFDGNWNPLLSCPVVADAAVGIGGDETGALYIASGGWWRVVKTQSNPCLPTPTAVPPPQSGPPQEPGNTYIYPSPVRGGNATVAYQMAEPGRVEITLWNENAERVLAVADGKGSGFQTTPLDLSRLPTGVYFYRLVMSYASGRSERTRLRKFVALR